MCIIKQASKNISNEDIEHFYHTKIVASCPLHMQVFFYLG